MKMSLTAIGVGNGSTCRYWWRIRYWFCDKQCRKAIAQQPEAHGKIRSTLLIGAALAEATAIYGFVLGS